MGMRLTDIQVKRAKPAEKAYLMYDSGGLFLFVTPAGGKLWRWKYRHEGREKLMALGKYPEVSLADAREHHAEQRKTLARGQDPMAKRKMEKSAIRQGKENSFRNVALLWHKHWQNGKSARHIDVVLRRMEADIFPILGERPIDEIEAPELVAMVKRIEKRGVSDLAKRALENTGQVFRYAIAHGLARRNPATDFRPSDVLKPTQKKNLARIDAKELPRLLRAIEVYQGTHITRLAMKLLALTFVRTTELIGAKWAEVDLENARWDIPAERMKMDTPHIVPLSTQAIEVLETLCLLSSGSEWLFPGERRGNKPISNNTILGGLKRMGYKGRMTGHGFRGVASTILHEQGFPHDHIELQLAHAPRNAVSAAYNHALYLEPRTQMMRAWGDFLEKTQRSGRVLSFQKGVA
jgi:integrase